MGKVSQEIMLEWRRPIKWVQWVTFWTTLWLVVGAGGLPVIAQDASDAEVRRRLAFIEERLDGHQQHTEIWHGAWTVINGGATVGLAISAGLASSSDDRINFATQSVVALIGVGDQYLFRPIPGLDGANPIRTLPDTTSEERREKLAKAEAILRASAAREAERTGWIYHAGNAALNGLAGTVIGVFGDTKDGIIAGAAMRVARWDFNVPEISVSSTLVILAQNFDSSGSDMFPLTNARNLSSNVSSVFSKPSYSTIDRSMGRWDKRRRVSCQRSMGCDVSFDAEKVS